MQDLRRALFDNPRFRAMYEREQDARTYHMFEHVAQVAVAHPNNMPYLKKSGTISFIRTAERALFITCRHVYEAFLQARAKRKKVRWLIYGSGGVPPLDASDYELVDMGGRHLDLAVLSCPDPEVILSLNKRFCELWPPVRAGRGDLAIAFGCPTERRFTREHTIQVRLRRLGGHVSSSVDAHAIIVDEGRSRFHFRAPDSKSASSRLNHGGMSGGAVFLFNEALRNPRLTGFLYETTKGAHAHLLVVHADYIHADGTLDHARIAW
jgi:hypothetical protein